MNRHDPAFHALVQRISAGEITREQAAAEAGVPLNTFKTWLQRSGALAQLKHTRRSVGALHYAAEQDARKVAAYAEAVAECLREHNPPSVLAVAKRYAARGVDYKWLLHKVKQAKEGGVTLFPDNVGGMGKGTNAPDTASHPG